MVGARLSLARRPSSNCWRLRAATRGVFEFHAGQRRTEAAFLARNGALFREPHHAFELGVDPLVPPAIVEEILQDRPVVAPGLQRQFGDLRQLAIVIGQFALAPVMHHQKQIGAMLRRGQMTGIAEIVADIKRHPRSLHPARPPWVPLGAVDPSPLRGGSTGVSRSGWGSSRKSDMPPTLASASLRPSLPTTRSRSRGEGEERAGAVARRSCRNNATRSRGSSRFNRESMESVSMGWPAPFMPPPRAATVSWRARASPEVPERSSGENARRNSSNLPGADGRKT